MGVIVEPTAGTASSSSQDVVLLVDTSAGAVIFVLPDATTCQPGDLRIIGPTGPGVLTFSTVSGQTVNSSSTYSSSTGGATFVTDAENWYAW
jgi:hypothetical protein